jgi:hypothetical protein
VVGIGFVAFVTAFIADRFISTSQEAEAPRGSRSWPNFGRSTIA